MRPLMRSGTHFAIMLSAFIYTSTAGTRVDTRSPQKFQEERAEDLGSGRWTGHWIPGTILSTTLVVWIWACFSWTANISTIWPMFGTANQLLAVLSPLRSHSAIINRRKVRYPG